MVKTSPKGRAPRCEVKTELSTDGSPLHPGFARQTRGGKSATVLALVTDAASLYPAERVLRGER